MPVTFPRRLKLAQTPTPLQPLDRLSAELGGPRIWVKRDDMTGCGVSGNKIRKLEFSLAAAIDSGCDTIITAGGVQSNHCRTTALLSAQLGLRCHLILRGAEEAADGNLLLDRLAGAEISFYSNSEYCARETEILNEWQNHYRDQGNKAYCIPVGASDGVGLWGYIAACQELADDFAKQQIKPAHIITATGSGGTQGGLTVGSELFGLDAKVWGINVCDNRQYFIDKVTDDVSQWIDWYKPAFALPQLQVNVIDGYVGAGYARCSAEVFETIKRLARTEGIVLDPVYTGKAFHGLIDQIGKGRFGDGGDVVFIHTGGLFGLFPQRDQLSFP